MRDPRVLDLQELVDLARGRAGRISFGEFQEIRTGRSRVAALRAFYRLRNWLALHSVDFTRRTVDGETWLTLDVEAAARLLPKSDTIGARSAVQVRRVPSNAVTRDADVTLLSVKAAARQLDMSAPVLRRRLAGKRPLLPYVVVGEREKKIRLSDLRAFLEARVVGARP